MPLFKSLPIVCLTAAAALWVAGCNNAPPAGPTTTTGKQGEHDHDHGAEGHDHAHDHGHEGPHGGHLLEPDTEGYHFEWTHTDEGNVTVYVLDGTAKKDLPIAASEIAIDVKIGNKPQSFKLAAVDPGEDKKAAKFEIVDKQLLGVLEALKPDSKGVTATVVANIEGQEKPITAKIEADSHEHKH